MLRFNSPLQTDALSAYSCANTGVVSLGASQTTGTYLLPRLIAVFRQRNPQVVVKLQVHDIIKSSWCWAAVWADRSEMPHDMRHASKVPPA